MEAASKTPASLSLPWKTRLAFKAFGTITHAARRRDGTINRGLLNFFLSKVPPSSKPIKGVKTYDVTVDPTRNLWFRVFVPTEHAVQDLPLIVFIHGGGFAFLSADEKHNDDVCREMARKVPALIVSVEYRLTPEHRYPAQHDDCFDVLKFLDDDQNRSKCSLENANISRCFIVGDSSGGNIAHHVAQRACEFNFQRLKVRFSLKQTSLFS
ncbi:putative carboxylesterase [Helianthus anomalus]